MSRSQSQIKLDKYFKTTPLAYQPGLIRIFGPATGLFLYQLLYWNQKEANNAGWIYKTQKEFQAETGLTRCNQDTSTKNLLKLEVIDYRLAQTPAKRHFRVRMDKLVEILPGLMEKNNLHYLKPPTQFVGTQQTNTETTQKITTPNKDSSKISTLNKKRQLLAEKMNVSQ